MEKEDLKYLLLNFTNKPENISKNIDIIINKYYSKRERFQNYKESKKVLAQLIIEGNIPTCRQWNKIAQKEGLYSSNSIQYIEGLKWRQIVNVIIREIKEILEKQV